MTLSGAANHDIYLTAIEYSGVDPIKPVHANSLWDGRGQCARCPGNRQPRYQGGYTKLGAASVATWNATASSMRAVNQSVVQLIALGPAPLQAVTGHPDGTYSFSDVVNMNYIVTPNKTGLKFSPASTAE